MSGGPVGRQARTLALHCLYVNDARGPCDFNLMDWLCTETAVAGSVRRNAESMVSDILSDVDRLDEIIGQYAPALPVKFLAIVDRNILRVTIYELTSRENVPRRVIVNEATELASLFGSESSARFVNGVLGSVLNNMFEVGEADPARVD